MENSSSKQGLEVDWIANNGYDAVLANLYVFE